MDIIVDVDHNDSGIQKGRSKYYFESISCLKNHLPMKRLFRNKSRVVI